MGKGEAVEDGGWKGPERCQGNVGQGNGAGNALLHSLDNYSPDFGFFPQSGGREMWLELIDSSPWHGSAANRNQRRRFGQDLLDLQDKARRGRKTVHWLGSICGGG
jgi:hypothetical protein